MYLLEDKLRPGFLNVYIHGQTTERVTTSRYPFARAGLGEWSYAKPQKPPAGGQAGCGGNIMARLGVEEISKG